MKYKIGDVVLIKQDIKECNDIALERLKENNFLVRIERIFTDDARYPYDTNIDVCICDNDVIGKIRGNKIIKE